MMVEIVCLNVWLKQIKNMRINKIHTIWKDVNQNKNTQKELIENDTIL